jgi:hypothetical protein
MSSNNNKSISKQIQSFYGMLKRDPFHRYRSWEHCFVYFRRHKTLKSQADIDIAALHLAFYLASWGMYRGSSALLWKDYKVHKDAVQNLLDPAFAHLWDLRFDDIAKDARIAKDILALSNKLKRTYCQRIKTVKGKARPFHASDTLITKILLGTLGCVPACDQYFIKGFRKTFSYSRFHEKFLCRTFDFYRQNKGELEKVQSSIAKQSGLKYPIMKLVDMYFWEIGSKI